MPSPTTRITTTRPIVSGFAMMGSVVIAMLQYTIPPRPRSAVMSVTNALRDPLLLPTAHPTHKPFVKPAKFVSPVLAKSRPVAARVIRIQCVSGKSPITLMLTSQSMSAQPFNSSFRKCTTPTFHLSPSMSQPDRLISKLLHPCSLSHRLSSLIIHGWHCSHFCPLQAVSSECHML